MSTPAWILEILAAVMILVAEVSAGQLVVARAWTRRGGVGADIAVSRLLMGVALAGVLVPELNILPYVAWEVVFAVTAAWFVGCLWRGNQGRSVAAMARGPYPPHLVHSAAMLYLFVVVAGPSAGDSGTSMAGMAGMGGMSSGVPVLALIFALSLVAFTVHDLNRRADVDGYFRVAGRSFGSAPGAAAAGPAPGARPVVTDAPAHSAERLLLSPGMAKGCQVVTGVTIAFTLIIMT